jgi:hypothetical protein
VTRALWLPAVLRAAGLSVSVVPGWEQRGADELGELRGVLLHHTAGPRTGNYPSLAVVRDGRPDLPGPLAHCGLARDGTWLVIASGWANHAGRGALPWVPVDAGNAHLIGVEAESTGVGDDWTVEQIHAYPVGVAAILAHLGLPAARAAGHMEYAPTRKIDPAGWPGGMDGFRAAVAAELAGEDDDMRDDERAALFELRDAMRAAGIGKGRLPGRSIDPTRNAPDDAFGWILTAAGKATDAATAATTAANRAQAAPVIDYDQLAAALLRQMSQPTK